MEEGIMALPQGSMQEQGRPPVSSLDAYDAALTASTAFDPTAATTVRQSLQSAVSEEMLNPEEVDLIIGILEDLLANPSAYKAKRQSLIDQGYIEAEDLPEEFDQEFLSTMLIAFNELKMSRADGAMAPLEAAPTMQNMPAMGMAKGGLADVAQYLASKGRGGDTMLAHITPSEAALLKRMGGSGTINPETGLPEYFLKWLGKKISSAFKSVGNAIKKVLKSPIGRIIGTIALATVLGPTSIGLALGQAGTAALASGAVTLASGGTLKQALVAGAMGYFGGGGTIGGISPVTAIGGYLPGAVGSALNTGLSTAALGTGIGLLTGMKPQEALSMGLSSGAGSGIMAALGGAPLVGSPNAQAGGVPLTEATQQGSGTSGEVAGPSSAGQVDASPLIKPVDAAGTAKDILQTEIPGSSGSAPITAYSAPPAPPSGPASVIELNKLPTDTYSSSGIPIAQYDISDAALNKAGYVLNPPSGSSSGTAPTGFFDKVVQGGKDLYNTYLSPDRPGLAPDAGVFTKYGPLVAAGLGVTSLAGGFKQKPNEEAEATAKEANDYWAEMKARAKEREEELARLGYGFDKTIPNPPGSVPVESPIYSSIPVSAIPVYRPQGVTFQPGGVPQPYNVAGLYNIPQIYTPRQAAKGGEMTSFPRKTGPINGPGTGTSDSIPAMLSDGEFVFTAKAVRNAGGGSRRKGAARMYKLMKMLEGGPVGRNA